MQAYRDNILRVAFKTPKALTIFTATAIDEDDKKGWRRGKR
jgi:hypothetical protein